MRRQRIVSRFGRGQDATRLALSSLTSPLVFCGFCFHEILHLCERSSNARTMLLGGALARRPVKPFVGDGIVSVE